MVQSRPLVHFASEESPVQVGNHEYDVSVVLAAYNEEESILEELRIVKQAMDASPYSYEIILVDDASTDRTSELARSVEGITYIRHPFNIGSGGARKTGTLAARGEIVVWSDVDLTYPNAMIPELVDYLHRNGYEQVVGARESEKGTLRWLRAPTKWFIRSLAVFLTGVQIPDLNSGMRAFRRETAYRYLYLLPDGFSGVSTLTLAFLSNGHPVGYVRVPYYKRTGRSKFRPIGDTYNYLVQVVRMVTYFQPLKVFLPLSLILFALGSGLAIYNVITTVRIHSSEIIVLLTAVVVAVLGFLADLISVQGRRLDYLYPTQTHTYDPKTPKPPDHAT
jgi:glycosyltransferase involved in cell wall biosynthesis